MEDIYVGGKKPRRDNNPNNMPPPPPPPPPGVRSAPAGTRQDIPISKSRNQNRPIRPDYGNNPTNYAPYQNTAYNGGYTYNPNAYGNYDSGFNGGYEQPPRPAAHVPVKTQKKKGKALFAAFCAMMLCFVMVAGFGISLVYNTFSSVNYIEPESDENAFIADNSLMQSSAVKNILLIAVDRRNPDDAARSDTMLLVSINSDTKKIKLTSFMRDSYVYIPEKEKSSKLNAACTWGGAPMVMDTIEYNFHVKIDHYMMVDFVMFEEIIDGLGGVDVEVTEKEAKYMRDDVHLDVQAGESVHLDGNEALWYCRIRKLDSDFMRTGRQRKVMTALIEKCKKTNPIELYNLISEVASRIETDMSPSTLTSLAVNGLLRYLSYDIEQGSVPAEGTWKSAKKSGQSVLSLDLDANIKYLKEFIYEE